MIDEYDYIRTEYIVCPYCGYVNKDSWEVTESGDVFCDECEKEFYVEREIDVKFTSVATKE